MFLHMSTFKMSSSGSSLCLAKIIYRFYGPSKMKLLKYKMINVNKMFIVQQIKGLRRGCICSVVDVVSVPVWCLLRAGTAITSAAIANFFSH